MTEQINTQLTDEQALAELERRVAAMEPGPFRREWEGIVAIERNRQRCRAIEEATRVKLPPDTNRWRLSGLPPPASAPQAEPSAQRPSGWAKFDAIGPPPGIRYVDALCDAQDARDRAALIEADRQHRQAILDAFAEDKLIDEQRRRKQAERSCHVGPGDPDWSG
jgi:hypothetical protein